MWRRGRTQEERRSVGSLSRRHQSICNGHCRLPHVFNVSVTRRCVRVPTSRPAQYLTELQLYGSAGRLRPDTQVRSPALYVFVSRCTPVTTVWELSTTSQNLFLVSCVCRCRCDCERCSQWRRHQHSVFIVFTFLSLISDVVDVDALTAVTCRQIAHLLVAYSWVFVLLSINCGNKFIAFLYVVQQRIEVVKHAYHSALLCWKRYFVNLSVSQRMWIKTIHQYDVLPLPSAVCGNLTLTVIYL